MAKKENLIVGLDIGTTKVCVVVGEVTHDGVDIIGIGSHPSRGLRRGVIVNIEATIESIKKAIEEASHDQDIVDPRFAPLTLDRETQIAYAAVGLDAPLEAKKTWDPDQMKRKKLKAAIEQKVPDVEVLIGGMTTIDVTKKGINKSYGVNWFSKRLGIPPQEMLYVADALYPGGNDEVVIPTGIKTRSTSGPDETLRIIDEVLAQMH